MIQSTFPDAHDSEIIDSLLKIHAPGREHHLEILDCTHNTGKMWVGSNADKRLTTMDIDSSYKVDFYGDFKCLTSYFGKNAFDVIVFDPPHLPNASEGASGIYESHYGITKDGRPGLNVNELFTPFLVGAKEILRPDGIILTKICDIIQGRHFQWQMVEFINCVRECGMIPCDLAIKTRKNPVISSKWNNQYHLRKNHSYWIVTRLKNCQRKRVR